MSYCMTERKFQELAKNAVAKYCEKTFTTSPDDKHLTSDDFYTVWFCKTIQHFKMMIGSDSVEGTYFEVTYNGDTDELYIDEYKFARKETVKNIKSYYDSANYTERHKFVDEIRKATKEFIDSVNKFEMKNHSCNPTANDIPSMPNINV